MERGSEILLADISSVLQFESRPEIVDFARLCCRVLLLGRQRGSPPEQPGPPEETALLSVETALSGPII